MEKNYVEQHDGGYWVQGTRISLDSVVYAFKRDESPIAIQRSFPSLSLEEVFGTIAFYLANQDEIEAYLEKAQRDWEIRAAEINADFRRAKPELFERLQSAKTAMRKVSEQQVEEGLVEKIHKDSHTCVSGGIWQMLNPRVETRDLVSILISGGHYLEGAASALDGGRRGGHVGTPVN